MFTQTKQYNYDLYGTSQANNSLSSSSNLKNSYEDNMNNNITFEQFDAVLSEQLDQIVFPEFPSFGLKQSSIQEAPMDYLVN